MIKNKITNIEIVAYAKKTDTLTHFIKMMKKKNRNDNDDGYYKQFFVDEITPLKNDISNDELANRLNTSWEMLRKRLNQSKDLSRDYLIAVCSQIQIGSFLTNYALGLAKLPLLCAESKPKETGNPEDKVTIINLRDKKIINILDRCADNYMSIPQINSELKLEFNKLQLYNEFPEEISYPFVIIGDTKIEIDYDYAIYNPCDSLETLYDITQYKIKATKKIKLNNTQDILSLTLFDNSSARITKNNDLLNSKAYENYKDLNNAHYSFIFEELHNDINLKRKEIFLQLDDSKHYNKRISAKYTGSGIQVFSETFNFIIPEKNEYFFVEYFEHKFHFYITNRSQFMHYQSKDHFNKYIKKYDPLIQHEFNSIEEIKSYFIENPSSDVSSYFDKKMISTFEELYNETKNLLIQIKLNKIYIRNPEIYDGPNSFYDMCKYFALDNNFEFAVQEGLDYPEPIYKNNKNCIEVDNLNSKITITKDDIYNAFIYGLNTVEDICSIKSKSGTIQNWISNL